MGWLTAVLAAIAAVGAGANYLSSDANVDVTDKEYFKNQVLGAIDRNSPAYEYVKNMPASSLYTIAEQNGLVDTRSKFGTWWNDDTVLGYQSVADLLDELGKLEFDASDYPEYKYFEDVEKDVMAELEADDARQTQLFEDQLRENQMMFDDYRSQVLGNQYQQNAQLMGSVDSAMSKARRNALEAGASAGLRMAENINTTLALQNKQAQTSLETSNQLAQQLLNQRQAAAGIRSDYSDMVSSKSDRYYNRLNNAWGAQQTKNEQAYSRYLDNFDDYNAFSSGYADYLRKQNTNKNTANVTNKTSSQYGS